MATKIWTFALDDGLPHRVELDHNTSWGKLRVRIDGGEARPLGRSRVKGLDGEYPITVGGHDGVLYLRRSGLAYAYDLALDGRSVETGQPPAPAPPLPVWGWVFLALCAPLMIGGGLGAGLAVSSGLFCYGIARDASRPALTRALICAGIVVAAWIAYLALVTAFTSAIHRPH